MSPERLAVATAGQRSGIRREALRAYDSRVTFDRISVDHTIMGGVPCIRGTRIPVATVVGMVAEGMSVDEILDEFSQLTREDVQEALRYAAAAVDERELPLRPAG
jgi:uncharacterized protein (DUF433 family)